MPAASYSVRPRRLSASSPSAVLMLMTHLQSAGGASATYHEDVITVLAQALAGIVMMRDVMSLALEGTLQLASQVAHFLSVPDCRMMPASLSSGTSALGTSGGCTMTTTVLAPLGLVACLTASRPARILDHWLGSPCTASLHRSIAAQWTSQRKKMEQLRYGMKGLRLLGQHISKPMLQGIAAPCGLIACSRDSMAKPFHLHPSG